MTLKQSFGAFWLAPAIRNVSPLASSRAEIAEAQSGDTKARTQSPPVLTEHKCDKCGAPMAIRSSARGQFLVAQRTRNARMLSRYRRHRRNAGSASA
jgi:hypothetical protein